MKQKLPAYRRFLLLVIGRQSRVRFDNGVEFLHQLGELLTRHRQDEFSRSELKIGPCTDTTKAERALPCVQCAGNDGACGASEGTLASLEPIGLTEGFSN